MGRTKRKRRRKINNFTAFDDVQAIDLQRWMSELKWKNSAKLKLRIYPQTGRGITSTRTIKENDVLMRVPYELMITLTTISEVQELIISDVKQSINMQTLLSLYLALEKHKGPKSIWRLYIASLPKIHPALPWLLPWNVLEKLPRDLFLSCKRAKLNFEQCLKKLMEAINRKWHCPCCGETFNCVITNNLFVWSYIMVNTRAVYVNPQLVRRKTKSFMDALSDEPSMALCPFLDMFNHNDLTRTKAELIETKEGDFFELTTLSNYAKHTEIFISYGEHSNVKLLTEYGFFISNNVNDKIMYECDEVLKCLEKNLSLNQYKFIKTHFTEKILYIDKFGANYNLKGLLFVIENDHTNYAAIIYNEKYPHEFYSKLKVFLNSLLTYKFSEYEADIVRFELAFSNDNECTKNISMFLESRKSFIRHLQGYVQM